MTPAKYSGAMAVLRHSKAEAVTVPTTPMMTEHDDHNNSPTDNRRKLFLIEKRLYKEHYSADL
jgi:hypothetical protein